MARLTDAPGVRGIGGLGSEEHFHDPDFDPPSSRKQSTLSVRAEQRLFARCIFEAAAVAPLRRDRAVALWIFLYGP